MDKPAASFVAVMSSCVFYIFMSTITVIANKYISAGMSAEVKADIPQLAVIFYQCLIALVMVEGARVAGFTDYPPFRVEKAKTWIFVNILFIGMLSSNFMSFVYCSVPLVAIFKNLTNLATVLGDWYFFGESVTPLTLASIAVIILSALLSGINDLEFSMQGYLWMLANCLFTAAYALYMRYLSVHIKLPKMGMVYYNNLLSVLILFPICLFTGDFAGIMKPEVLTPQFMIATAIAGVCGCCLNFASLWCISLTSATTYAIAGSMNKIPVAVLGFLLFEVHMTWNGVCYLCLATAGGFLFAYAKLVQSQDKARMVTKSLDSPPETKATNHKPQTTADRPLSIL